MIRYEKPHRDTTSPTPGTRHTQPTLYLDSQDNVRMVMRSRSHFMGIAKSDRQGHVWQAAHQSAVPCPNSGLDVARLSDGRLLLVYNPSMHFGAPSSSSSLVGVIMSALHTCVVSHPSPTHWCFRYLWVEVKCSRRVVRSAPPLIAPHFAWPRTTPSYPSRSLAVITPDGGGRLYTQG